MILKVSRRVETVARRSSNDIQSGRERKNIMHKISGMHGKNIGLLEWNICLELGTPRLIFSL